MLKPPMLLYLGNDKIIRMAEKIILFRGYMLTVKHISNSYQNNFFISPISNGIQRSTYKKLTAELLSSFKLSILLILLKTF